MMMILLVVLFLLLASLVVLQINSSGKPKPYLGEDDKVLPNSISEKGFGFFRILYAGFAGFKEFSELSALSHSPKMFAINISIQDPIEPGFVDINGGRLGFFIKGKSLNNPILLYLHEGMPDYLRHSYRNATVKITRCINTDLTDNDRSYSGDRDVDRRTDR